MSCDNYLTKQVEESIKDMEDRRMQEINTQDEKIINNFKENINYALIEKDLKKTASLTNSFALYINTILDIKENKIK